MQSVYLFLPASRSRVEEWLNRHAALAAAGRQWVYPDAARPSLRIEVNSEVVNELEPETRRALRERLGPGAHTHLVVDVSRGNGGGGSVSAFVVSCLEEHGGLAMDDHSDELWTLENLADGILGHERFAAGY